MFIAHWTRRKLLLVLLTCIALPAVTVGAYRVMRPGNASPTGSVLPAPEVLLEHDDPAVVDVVFDLEPKDGEHPFAPALRLARQSLETIDATVADYCCTFIKREQVGGKLFDQQTIQMRVRHNPLSVYLRFVEPFEGLECLYVEGANDDKLLVKAGDWRRQFGVVALDPTGPLAMQGQRYSIRRIGLRRLVSELIEVGEQEMQLEKGGDCQIVVMPHAEVAGRAATMIEVTHPVERPEYRCYRSRIFIDNELCLPIRFAAWGWPPAEGEEPPLWEEYTYADLNLNNGYTSATFSPDNPDIFP